jgi:hypothetical protein
MAKGVGANQAMISKQDSNALRVLALLDLSHRGDIVLDPFLGSGSALIASEKMGRICRGLELDPLYVDAIIRRYEVATGKAATLNQTGEDFSVLAARRRRRRLLRSSERSYLRSAKALARLRGLGQKRESAAC